MPSLKELKGRINSVKSTQKITSAMKMVAASKLKKAQEAAESARPYAERMERMLGALASSVEGTAGAPPLLAGTGSDHVHLLVVMTSDRGLCGGFNANIIRETRRAVAELQQAGKVVKILCVGRKGRDVLKRDLGSLMVADYEGFGRRGGVSFDEATTVADKIRDMFEHNEFDVCTILYNRFRSAITQVVTQQQIIPFPVPERVKAEESTHAVAQVRALYEFEPSEEGILHELLPRNVSTQVFRALLESSASEHGARMTAMDNATRNAGDMIKSLTLRYNRTRQANITKELIEIISGAEAL